MSLGPSLESNQPYHLIHLCVIFRSDTDITGDRLEASYRPLRMVGKLTLSSKNTERSQVGSSNQSVAKDLIHEGREAGPRLSTSQASDSLLMCSIVRSLLGMMFEHVAAQTTKRALDSGHSCMVVELLPHLILPMGMPVTDHNFLRVNLVPQANISVCRVW